MKYQAPENCPGISVGGEQFNVDDNGQITVPDGGNYGELLAPHGFTPVPPTNEEVQESIKKAAAEAGSGEGQDQVIKKPSDGLTAAQLKDELTSKGIEFAGNASKADLAALLDAAPAAEAGSGEGQQG